MATISEVHPRPEEAAQMHYAPGIYVEGVAGLLFIAGATASPLYHKHPHVPEEHVLPDDIKAQTRMALANIKLVLDAKRLTWRNVVKITKYLTDMREMDAMSIRTTSTRRGRPRSSARRRRRSPGTRASHPAAGSAPA